MTIVFHALDHSVESTNGRLLLYCIETDMLILIGTEDDHKIPLGKDFLILGKADDESCCDALIRSESGPDVLRQALAAILNVLSDTIEIIWRSAKLVELCVSLSKDQEVDAV